MLMLASFFCVHKNYSASLNVITYALQKHTDEKIYTGALDCTLSYIQKHVVTLMMKNEKLHTIAKSLTVNAFRFDMNSSLVPKDLQQKQQQVPN